MGGERCSSDRVDRSSETSSAHQPGRNRFLRLREADRNDAAARSRSPRWQNGTGPIRRLRLTTALRPHACSSQYDDALAHDYVITAVAFTCGYDLVLQILGDRRLAEFNAGRPPFVILTLVRNRERTGLDWQRIRDI